MINHYPLALKIMKCVCPLWKKIRAVSSSMNYLKQKIEDKFKKADILTIWKRCQTENCNLHGTKNEVSHQGFLQ